MSWLNLNGKLFSQEEILNFDSTKANTEFEKSTLGFCKAWLNDKQEFTIQTSGSTGAPKQIVLLRWQMEASAQQTVNALKLKPDYTALVCLDTKYIAGQMMLVRSLLLGMNIIAVEPTSNPFEKIDQNFKIDFAAFVPLQIETILNKEIDSFDRTYCAIIGGAAVSNSLKEKIAKVNCEVYATYGMTETISHIALQRLNGENPQDHFEALDNVKLRLDDRGCLCITTDYLKDEIITNDLVEIVSENKFRWLGRVDNVINSGGIKVIPEKVEEVIGKILESLKIMNRFFIAGIADEKLGKRVALVMEGKAIENKIQNQIILEASQNLSKYELPKDFLFIEKFEETENGKIKRKLSLDQ